MEPSLPNWVMDGEFSDDVSNDIPVTKLNCPKSTVPIRRLNRGDLRLQAQLRRECYAHLGGNHSNDIPSKIFLAMVQSKAGQPKTFYGIGSTLSIYNPSISQPEYSSAEVMIKGGNDVIIAGWTVNPNLYKDTQTRSFTYAVDAKSGDWWLQTGGKSVGRIGFWPKKIFKGLSESGSYVACGGEASGLPTKIGFPEMGFGIRPELGGGREWPFCWNTKVINADKKAVIYDDFEEFSRRTPQYVVYYDERNHRAIFGGPKHLA